jgi:2-polyprenyl-3-methyl-5-hydroxy-6-metoxy-1,4-benzoquinol methylase
MKTLEYSGNELDIFSLAVNWKRYWASLMSPYIRGNVLEVGAGIGNNTLLLRTLHPHTQWICLEPDASLIAVLRAKIRAQNLSPSIQIVTGTLSDLPMQSGYHTILYIDVLEHIEDDLTEIQQAANLLAPSGYLIVLVPAHSFLYTTFDRHIGHYRRYTVRSLNALQPKHCALVAARYLDSVGFFASLANRLFLRQHLPTARQIRFWDRVFVRMSLIIDRLTLGKIGKSALIIWRKL